MIIFNDKQCRKVVSHGYNIITCKDSVRVGSEAVRHETNERLPRAPFGDATVDTLFMALPTCADTKKSRGKLRWFYFKSEKDLLKWMRAFSKAIGKDKLFDQIMETIREQELFHLQANPVRPNYAYESSNISFFKYFNNTYSTYPEGFQ